MHIAATAHIGSTGLKLSISATNCFICITEGMLRATKSDDELAAILCHELGHFVADHQRETLHQIRMVQRQCLPWMVVSLPGAAMTVLGGFLMEELLFIPGLMMLVPLAPFAMYLFYKSRAREGEADHIGLLLTAHAGYDPEAAISAQGTLGIWERAHWEKQKQRNGQQEPASWTRTHCHVRTPYL